MDSIELCVKLYSKKDAFLMQCPKCDNHISPFKVWLISRWAPLKCDKCGTFLNRQIDRQFFIIAVLFFTGLFLFAGSFIWLLVWLLVVMLIDAYTIRLVAVDGQGRA
jgi:uncharacterized paraquat-inducible protein A